MSNYIVTTDFAAKDALPSGNPGKVAQGTQIDTELDNIATAVATKEDTANKGSANGYAGLDSGAVVPRSQLPTAVAYEDEAMVLTTAGVTATPTLKLSSTLPLLQFDETDAAANNKRWQFQVNGETFSLSLVNDAGSGTSILIVDRTGITVDNINLLATTVQINGNTAWHAGNDGAGSGLDADLLDGSSSAAFATASHNHSATELTSGTLADARVAASNVAQHVAKNISAKTGTVKTLSTSAPSGGADGDIWYRY